MSFGQNLRRERELRGISLHEIAEATKISARFLQALEQDRLDVLPGITALWQVSARRDPSFEKNVLLDLEYIENWNVVLDLKIALRTIPEVFRGSGH